MLYHETIKIPGDRVGVIVGRDGRVRKRVEELTNVKIDVNSEGVVTITAPETTEDPVLAWKARDIIRAMARGFSPKNAFSLIDDDMQLLVISLRDAVGASQNQMKRVAGRIIGENGRTRSMSPGLEYARKAIDMLIAGAPHSTVYSRLENMRRELNRQKTELWEDTDL
jgi:ribosomal RNA assembly protein